MSGYDTTINYTQKYYNDIFTYLLQGAYGLGLLNSTDAVVNADGTLANGNGIENVMIMEYSIIAYKISEMYLDLTTVNNGQNPNLAPVEDTINYVVVPTDALAILCTPFIGAPYGASYSVTEVDFYVATPNTSDVIIPQGTIIQSEIDNTITFQTTQQATLLAGTNDVIIPVMCVTSGPAGNVPANCLTLMESPIIGVDSVNNANPATGGNLGETASNYLSRFNQWKYSNVRGTVDALGTAINSVSAVNGYYIQPHPLNLPSTVYVGLSSTPPTTSGGNVTEPSGGGYARVSSINTNWIENSNGGVQNNSTITFPTSTGSWGTENYFVVYDAPTGGNLLFFGTITTQTISTGTTPSFTSGFLVSTGLGCNAVIQYGLTYITIDPPIDTVLSDVTSAVNLWKAADENVIISGVVETPVNINATINVDLGATISYSDSDKARFGQLAESYIETYINGGFDVNGNVRLELGIGQDLVLNQVIAYVLSQAPQFVDMSFASPTSNILILPNQKAVAGTINVTVI